MGLEVGSTEFKMLQLRHLLSLHFGEQRMCGGKWSRRDGAAEVLMLEMKTHPSTYDKFFEPVVLDYADRQGHLPRTHGDPGGILCGRRRHLPLDQGGVDRAAWSSTRGRAFQNNSLLLDPQNRTRLRFSRNGLEQVSKALWTVILSNPGARGQACGRLCFVRLA